MADTTEEMPLFAIQHEKMFNSWKSTIKVCAIIALFCAVYGYLHIYIRAYMIKTKRLQQIAVMVMETEKIIQNMYNLDQEIAADLEELNDLYLDY